MADAHGDEAWRDTDLAGLEGWFSLDDDLSDREWLQSAQAQLTDASVLPEHAGAPPPSVYAWNDAFISTYLMNIDSGLGRKEAVDSARQNANDTVELTRSEREMIKSDPDLY